MPATIIAVSEHPPSSEIEPTTTAAPTTPGMPFESLDAPKPIDATPPATARWLGFGSILLGGVLGGMIGWGTGDVLGDTSTWAAIGGLIGAIGGAAGVGVVATLTLRAMNEWNAVQHPEADLPQGVIGDHVDASTDD